jgi:predicted PurR-regulated permease PerM
MAKLRQLLNRGILEGRAVVASPDVASSDEDDLPKPADLKAVYLGGLFLLALLAACYAAAEIVLPMVLALVLKLVLQPVMRGLGRLHLPQGISALLIILVLFGAFAGIGTALSAPAASWAQKLPSGVPKLEQRLSFLNRPVAAFERYVEKVQSLAPQTGPKAIPVEIRGPGPFDQLLSGTRSFAGAVFETALLLFFMLTSGDLFLRRLVEILPRFRSKRQAVEIAQEIERDVSAYLLTISIMNLMVGIANGIVAKLCGLDDPLLWGALAFLLNFVPILGPMVGVVVFLLVGLLSLDRIWLALLPAGLYLIIHVIEGEFTTPMLLARRFTINPALIVLALIFWYWMWGIPGAILATPMLAIIKIICDRIGPLTPFGHFIEG